MLFWHSVFSTVEFGLKDKSKPIELDMTMQWVVRHGENK